MSLHSMEIEKTNYKKKIYGHIVISALEKQSSKEGQEGKSVAEKASLRRFVSNNLKNVR